MKKLNLFKQTAQRAHLILKELNIDISHAQCLEFLARFGGSRTLHVHQAKEAPRTQTISGSAWDLVPLLDVTNVAIDGKPFFLRYTDADILEAPLDDDTDLDSEVLNLGAEEDGFVIEQSLTIEDLQEAFWDTKEEVFKNKEGVSYKFFLELKFSP